MLSGLNEEKEAEEEILNMVAKLDVLVEVEAIRRMGGEKEGKTTFVWVKLGNKKQRNGVLEMAKQLRQKQQWKTVYINKDLTDYERKQTYLLRKELRERKKKRDHGNRKFVNREPADEEGIREAEEED